jgi:hypothetical protein
MLAVVAEQRKLTMAELLLAQAAQVVAVVVLTQTMQDRLTKTQ